MGQEERGGNRLRAGERILLIRPREPGGRENSRLLRVLREGFADICFQEVTEVSQLEAMTDQAGRLTPEGWQGRFLVLFAVDLGEHGINLEYTRLLDWLRSHPNGLDGWIGGVVADADSDSVYQVCGQGTGFYCQQFRMCLRRTSFSGGAEDTVKFCNCSL